MISVAMTTFNGLRFLNQQVESILVQLADDDELVIADNGSTDGTWQWLNDLAQRDPRVHLFQNLETLGVVANFDFALQRCHGELVFLADQDDYWHPGKIAAIRDAFANSAQILLVQSDADLIDENSQVVAPSFYALRRSGPGFWKNFARNTYQGCTFAVRQQLLAIALPFPAKVPMHDMWLGLLAELTGDVRFIPDRLTSYRRHGENLSGLSPRSAWQILVWRFNLALTLAGRLLGRRLHLSGPGSRRESKLDE
jgi:glycosyltransferase involved in cell wall biosynthesis